MKRIVVEGITAGALGATAVAAWFLLYDAAKGRLYFTPALLGAVLFNGLRDVSAVSISWPLVLGYSLFHWAAFALFALPPPRCWQGPTASRPCCSSSSCRS